eukprot:3430786-Pyramimonas_sp.AAC.1
MFNLPLGLRMLSCQGRVPPIVCSPRTGAAAAADEPSPGGCEHSARQERATTEANVGGEEGSRGDSDSRRAEEEELAALLFQEYMRQRRCSWVAERGAEIQVANLYHQAPHRQPLLRLRSLSAGVNAYAAHALVGLLTLSARV